MSAAVKLAYRALANNSLVENGYDNTPSVVNLRSSPKTDTRRDRTPIGTCERQICIVYRVKEVDTYFWCHGVYKHEL